MKWLLVTIFGLSLILTACKKEEAPAEGKAPAATETPSVAPATPGSSAPAAVETKTQAQQLQQAMGAMAQMAKAGEAMQKTGVVGSGKVVNWRKLAAFAPEKLGEFAAQGELKGTTSGMAGMQVSTVKRKYQAGEKTLRLEIVDTNLVPMMRAGFAMVQTINEDSSDGVKRGTNLQGQPALLEWKKARQKGKVTVLVSTRYIVNCRLEPAADPEAVLKVANGLDLKGLAALKED